MEMTNYINQVVNYHPQSLTISHQNDPKHTNASSSTEKLKVTRKYSTTIFSICYAMFLTIFGAIAFVGDAVIKQDPVPQIFCIFMLSTGLLYFIYLWIDIRFHVARTKKSILEREQKIKQYEDQMLSFEESNQYSQSINNLIPPIIHNYCFVNGRHGELLYLKIGASFFCIGLLIHSALVLAYQIPYVINDAACSDLLRFIVELLFPIYSLFMLFFIFKYCNVVIITKQWLARIMLMHAIGTQLSFWILTIVQETVDAIVTKEIKKEGKNYTTTTTMSIDDEDEDISAALSSGCPGPESVQRIYKHLEPYLFPFIIEFCILTVGIYYMMWSNIGNCPKREDLKSDCRTSFTVETENGIRTSQYYSVDLSHETQYKSHFVIHADCHAASRGLFSGMLLFIFKVVLIILLHIGANIPSYLETGVFVDQICEFGILAVLIVVTIVAYIQTSQLDVNTHSISKLDDVLLLIAIPAFFSETIFSLVPAVKNRSIINILAISAQLIQILIQTPWIIDALRRCSNSIDLRRNKPGRELVTFLTIANVALWIYYTFSVKGADLQDERYEFYGDHLWSILNHLSLPLIMFYRFHSSVCLVDIWKHGYEIN